MPVLGHRIFLFTEADGTNICPPPPPSVGTRVNSECTGSIYFFVKDTNIALEYVLFHPDGKIYILHSENHGNDQE